MNPNANGGSGVAVNAQPFVPSDGKTSASNPALEAKPFVPGNPLNAAPFVPGSSGAASEGLQGGSNLNPAAASVNAAVFIPGTGSTSTSRKSSIDARPFIPSTGTSPTAPASIIPPRPAAAAAAPTQPTAAPHPSLPDADDDLLGMKSVVPGGAKDLAAQAADMLRSFRPFNSRDNTPEGPPMQQQQQHGGGGRGRQHQIRGGHHGGTNPHHQQHQSLHHGGGPPPLQQQQQQQHHQAPGGFLGIGDRGGRGGRGRGGRGRGGRSSSLPLGSTQHHAGPGRTLAASRFMPESLREELQRRNYLIMSTFDPDMLHAAGIPDTIQQYHTLCPLEDVTGHTPERSSALGVRSLVLKGIHSGDGRPYALRRIDGRQVLPTSELLEAAQAAVQKWSPLAGHPYVVSFREAFASDEIEGMPAIYFSHDYHPGALTLEEAHMMAAATQQGLQHTPPTETQLWSYLTQLACAIRSAHLAGLAFLATSFAPSKVLLTAPGRVRVGCTGVAAVLSAEGAAQGDVSKQQQQDLVALGTLILTLAGSARGAGPPSLDLLMAHYSRELCQIVAGLLASAEGSGFTNWRSLLTALGDRVHAELEATALKCDELSHELQKECENGRLMRLMIKLGMINDRAELLGDDQWAETGDRYLLKLFRDFVFHQTDESGAPNTDWGLIIEALNKADAGLNEKILLLSRDEASMLVVSYADIKRCIEAAYGELWAAAAASSSNKF